MVNGAIAVANGIERLSREDNKSNSDYIAPLPEKKIARLLYRNIDR